MATTGELQAIIEELQLIDAGDAASYLGEEILVESGSLISNQLDDLSNSQTEFLSDYTVSFHEHLSFK